MSSLLGYTIDDQLKKKARNEALYYYHVDGKTDHFDDIK